MIVSKLILIHFYNTYNMYIYNNIEIYCFVAFYWSSLSQKLADTLYYQCYPYYQSYPVWRYLPGDLVQIRQLL